MVRQTYWDKDLRRGFKVLSGVHVESAGPHSGHVVCIATAQPYLLSDDFYGARGACLAVEVRRAVLNDCVVYVLGRLRGEDNSKTVLSRLCCKAHQTCLARARPGRR